MAVPTVDRETNSVSGRRRLTQFLRMERSPRAIKQLDGVRAIAILLVLGRHGVRCFVTPYCGRPPVNEGGELYSILGWDVATPLINGWVGVDLFFVLSGFLIASSLMRIRTGADGTVRLRPYLLKRILRIVPTYYVVLAIAALGIAPHYDLNRDELARRVVYHLLFLQDYFFSDIVVAFWSLGVEEKFYLTAPFIWYGITRLRHPSARYAALGGLILLGPVFRTFGYLVGGGADDYASFFFTFRTPFHMSLDPLYVGVLVALIHRDRSQLGWTSNPRLLNRVFWIGATVVGWLLFSHEMLAEPLGLFDHALQPLILALGMGAMVLALTLGAGPVRRLEGPGMFVLSKLAYSLYLTHMLVIPGVLVWVESWQPAGLTALEAFVLFLGPYLLASFTVAALLFYVVERPFLRIKDRISYDESPPRAHRDRELVAETG